MNSIDLMLHLYELWLVKKEEREEEEEERE